MREDYDNDPSLDPSEEEAANWLSKLDRTLTAAEQDAFFDWIAADPRNADALSEQRRNWERLDRFGAWKPEHSDRPNPDLIAPVPRKGRRWVYFLGALSAAAGIGMLFVLFMSRGPDGMTDQDHSSVVASIENRSLLEDGSVVKTKKGALFSVHFTDTERRLRFEGGEAFFMIAKDSRRPFVVEMRGVDVRAVGTAFNVKLEAEHCEVLVAEGIVSMEVQKAASVNREGQPSRNPPLLRQSHLAIVPLGTGEQREPEVKVLSKQEVVRRLDWQHGLMNFKQQRLSDIVEELNFLNTVQLSIADPELGNMAFSGSFRSDNVEGFARLLEMGFGAKADFSKDNEITLSRETDN